jgi:predicted dithiol-disulfide oxidoreductase (DUF899 family)
MSAGGLAGFILRNVSPARKRNANQKTVRQESAMNRSPQYREAPSRQLPRVGSHDEWLAARRELLAQEKQFGQLRDALSAQRRALPMVKVEKEYVFEGPGGQTTLRELFGRHRQLIVYHFMFDPDWNDGCKSCSHFMDNAAGSIVHLGARDTAFVVVSRAPLSKIEPFKRRMGWTFPWVSSFGTDFNYDFHVTLDRDAGSIEYNYANAADLVKAGKLWSDHGELSGLSVFLRHGSEVFHSYSTYQRGLDLPLNTYNFIDLTPLGRREDAIGPPSWIRHHDKYPE